MSGSKPFYTKLLEVYNLSLVNNSFIFSTISWLINEKFREYSTLNNHLKKQIEKPSEKLQNLAWSLRGSSDDETAINCLSWVKNNIKYKSETTEDWKDAELILKDGFGDCDDQNTLVYTLCYLAGIIEFKIFCAIGQMPEGGHFWCLYYSTEHEKIVSLDASYLTSLVSVKDRADFNSLKQYLTIWYLFNQEICVKIIKN